MVGEFGDSGRVGVGHLVAQRHTVAAVVGCNAVDEAAFLLDGQRLGVCADYLVEALHTALIAVQFECELAVGNAFGVRVVRVLGQRWDLSGDWLRKRFR